MRATAQERTITAHRLYSATLRATISKTAADNGWLTSRAIRYSVVVLFSRPFPTRAHSHGVSMYGACSGSRKLASSSKFSKVVCVTIAANCMPVRILMQFCVWVHDPNTNTTEAYVGKFMLDAPSHRVANGVVAAPTQWWRRSCCLIAVACYFPSAPPFGRETPSLEFSMLLFNIVSTFHHMRTTVWVAEKFILGIGSASSRDL